jgi:glycosyltransferase involved in cell wall biosynthesis
MPAFNKARTIGQIAARVLAERCVNELIIVDDCSIDGTSAALVELSRFVNVVVIRHDRNRGKGAALRTELSAATADLVVVHDADLEYDPAEYPKLIQRILDGKADVGYGSRFVGGESRRVLYLWHSVGNRVLTVLSNVFHRPKPHGHGDLLQGLSPGDHPGPQARRGPLRTELR